MIANLLDVLPRAQREHYGVGLFNTTDTDMLEAAIAAAEELRSPIIIGTAEVLLPYGELKLIAPAIIEAAKRASVPVVVHYDHGLTFARCMEAFQLGFTSVMFDGSTLPYEENVRLTCQVVEAARKVGACVEGEIGAMGKRELGTGDDAGDAEAIYTDPALAEDYIKKTGIDLLACSFGTAHGLYLKTPQLNFDVLKNVLARVQLPLVMHGGSGVSREDYRTAIASGIRKINYFTYMSKAGGEAMRAYVESRKDKPVYFYEADEVVYDAMKQNLKGAMAMFLGRD